MLVLTYVLLRPAFRPLRHRDADDAKIDPLDPGQRVPVVGEPDVAALAQAFNEMLGRLEHERRESARQALTVQEAERQRVARELHDEVGQVFTAIMLQIEGLAGHVPAVLGEELEELRETARDGATDVRRIASRLRPEALEDLGLHSALVGARDTAFGRQTGIAVERSLEPELGAEPRAGAGRVPRGPGGAHQRRAPRPAPATSSSHCCARTARSSCECTTTAVDCRRER